MGTRSVRVGPEFDGAVRNAAFWQLVARIPVVGARLAGDRPHTAAGTVVMMVVRGLSPVDVPPSEEADIPKK